MGKTVRCISPIDGSVYLEREALSEKAAFAAAARARAAQKDWAARPVQERVDLVLKANDYIGQTVDRMANELAHQMGRPIRYGGEFRGFNERLTYMASIAEESLKPYLVEDSGAFKRMIKREAMGVVLVVAPWNYPYMTAINTIAPALMAGNAIVMKPPSAGAVGHDGAPSSCWRGPDPRAPA